MNTNTYTIGKDTMRIDAAAKATGAAKFGDDIRLDHPLYIKGVYAEYAHAIIKNIDTSLAEKASGVAGVFTTKDVPCEKMIGELFMDQYVFADDKTRYWGDVVAVVAAESQAEADEAAKLVKVDYEPLPAITDPKEAIGNEQVINPDYPDNCCGGLHTLKGDAAKSLAESDIIITDHYETGFVEHAYIEPECVLAEPSLMRDEVTLYGSLQAPYNLRISVSRMTGVPQSNIIIKPSNIGGSFGGKIETAEAMACRAAIVALKTKRNVHYKLTREESFRESYKRHPIIFDMTFGADKEGHLKAMKVDALGDGGAYINMTVGVMFKNAALGPGPYKMESLDWDAEGVLTNNNHTGSMRGFGTPQAIFAVENMMDQLAAKVGVSPYEIRKRNLLHNNDISPIGQKMDWTEVSIEKSMDMCAEAIGYNEKYEKYLEYNKDPKHRKKKGLGIAVSMRGNSIGTDGNGFDVSRSLIEIMPDGSVFFNTGLVELGQGLRTAQAMMCAEGLGCDFSRVTIGETDTSRAPVTGACIASRGTLLGGNATKDACDKIHKIMAEAIQKVYNKPVDDIVFFGDKVTFSGQEITFLEAVQACYSCNMTPMAAGTYQVPVMNWDGHTGDAYLTYTLSCQMADVEVDIDTGLVEVKQMVGAHDMGRAINPIMAKGQIYGGMVMAQGMGLTEDLGHNKKDGTFKNLNYENYIIPTFADVPENNIPMLNENPDPRSAFGGHSLGEPATEPGAGALACAVNMALGKPGYIKTLPYDLDKVFFAARELDKEEK